ncbi:MAG: heavy metal translocating P-type ATPase metal-binding domain-containing protein [Crocinitomicaceae bacterium]|nr:heavy metal translocating P-type ATPase metal-binding domain-containing protein [Crocinitomicaceae bacterium]
MNTCYHCAGPCEVDLQFDNKHFCCEGCQTVYEILSGNSLENYYTLEKNPGIKAGKNYQGKFNFLDLPEFRERFVFFSEGNISRIRFFIPQIHCSSCLWLLERLSKIKMGVISSQVNFVKKEVEITFDESVLSLRELAELLGTIGYPPSISMKDYEPGSKKYRSDKRLIIQIGIAGFCFGNMMLLSFPEYLGIDSTYENFQDVFKYLNLLLSIPILLYCDIDYLKSAWKAVTTKHINIDVPITLGIIAFYFQSLYEIFTNTGAGYLDSFAGLIFFLLVGKWFQQTTYGSINFERDYKSYFPIAVSKIENESEKIVPLQSIKAGDRLVIRNNELIPADAKLISGEGRIDYSFVTGESALISKKSGEKLFAGGRQEGSSIEIETEKDVENSYLTKLWNNPVFDKEKNDRSFTEDVTRYFTFAILFIAAAGAIFWLITDPSKWLFVIVSVLIIACPCAIALSVPFTYGNGIRILGKKSLYLRSSKVIESVSRITDIVFDKTGTITHNNQSEIKWTGEILDEKENAIISTITAQSSHPLSRQIHKFLNQVKTNVQLENLTEIAGKGIHVIVNGDEYRIGSSSFTQAENTSLGTKVFVRKNNQVLGAFTFANSYRKDIENLFNQLGKKYQLHILSGDNESEKEKLEQLVPSGTTLNFNQQPEDKLNFISELQKKGKKVMMLGDGLNDAGALKQSNVGISVVDDVYSFSPSSDGIIDGQKLSQLDAFMEYCKFNKGVVKLSYVFSICYNLVGLSFALSGTLTPLVAAVLMPVSSISVVLLVTILTNLKGRKLF